MVRNNVWEAEITGAPNVNRSMKFDKFGDWSSSFGRPAGSDVRGYTNVGYATAVNGANLGLYMEDYSGAALVTVKIRFDDRSNEFAICRDTVRAICK